MAMKVIGLTGGIASGKSTVAAWLVERGIPVVDADKLYHRLIEPVAGEPSEVAQKIEAEFPGALRADHSLNRPFLGSLVFGQPEALKRLSAITHPAVAQAFMIEVQALQSAGEPLAVYDVPLLFERGMQNMLAGVAVVWVPKSVQIERLIARDKIDLAAAKSRLASQWSLDEKKEKATWVIDNSGDLQNTQEQVGRWITELESSII